MLYNFLFIFILTSSVMYGQTSKESLPAKISEQKEIKATNRLKKEIEQKQFTATPERTGDSTALLKSTDKKKSKKCKPGNVKESNE